MMRLSNVGDTIVEVLLGLAVLGSVLTAGYSLSTRSLSGVRASQERGEALKIAESQMELLRNYLYGVTSTSSPQYADITIDELTESAFCFYGNFPNSFQVTGNEISNLTLYNGNANAENCRNGDNNRYHIAITTETNLRSVNGPNPSTPVDVQEVVFTINVFWDRIGGGEQQSLQLNYKTVI